MSQWTSLCSLQSGIWKSRLSGKNLHKEELTEWNFKSPGIGNSWGFCVWVQKNVQKRGWMFFAPKSLESWQDVKTCHKGLAYVVVQRLFLVPAGQGWFVNQMGSVYIHAVRLCTAINPSSSLEWYFTFSPQRHFIRLSSAVSGIEDFN